MKWLVSFLLLSVAVSAQSQPPARGRRDANREVSQNSQTNRGVARQVVVPSTPPVSLNISIEAPTVEPRPQENQTHDPTDSAFDYWSLALNVLTTLFTFMLWRVAQNQYVKQSAQTDASLELTREQLAITKASNEITAVLNQQWLTGGAVGYLERSPDGDEIVTINFRLTNSTGMSVTFHRASFIIASATSIESIALEEGVILTPDIDESRVIPPRGYRLLSAGLCRLNSPEKLAAFDSGVLNITVSCIATFTDAFKQPRDQYISLGSVVRRNKPLEFVPFEIGRQHHPGQLSWFEEMRKKHGADGQGQPHPQHQ